MSNRSSSGLPFSSLKVSSRTSATSRAAHQNGRPDHRYRLKTCNICQEVGHIAKECPDKRCWTCGSRYHVQKNCPQQSENIRFLVERRTQQASQPSPGRVPQPYQVQRPPFETTIEAVSPATERSKPGTLLRCENCRSIFHSKKDCGMTNYKFGETIERSINELPSLPVLLTPIKTAAALATERQYAEKLAAIESENGEKEGRNKAGEEEEAGEKQGVSKANEPGDLIEFD